MDKSDLDLSVLIKHFEIHNRTEGKSPRTVEWYNEVLHLLNRWLQEQNMPTTLGFMNEMVIRQFTLHLQGRPGTKAKSMSSHSIYNRVNALRSFFGWLHERGYTEEHVLRNLRQPKTADLIIEPLTQEEIDKVLSVMNPNTSLVLQRRVAMIGYSLFSARLGGVGWTLQSWTECTRLSVTSTPSSPRPLGASSGGSTAGINIWC
jgi:site-specific recombinase XerD